jgi:uncharacterized protein (TIGR00251 family)
MLKSMSKKSSRIKIKVKPHSGEQNIEEKDGVYFVKLKSSATDGKANIELIKFLKKYFKADEVVIKSGFTSREKVVEMKG